MSGARANQRPGGTGAAPRGAIVISSRSDRELLERIAGEDREAFREFYERYAAKVLSYVRMLAHGRESEDVVQEVFLAVWRKAGSYRVERGDAPGWLYTITRNRMVDHWRRRPAGSEPLTADLSRLVASDADTENRLLAVSLRKSLGNLKVEQREALELAYFGGLTYEETAEKLNLPVGTLKSRIRAGLALLREDLAEKSSS